MRVSRIRAPLSSADFPDAGGSLKWRHMDRAAPVSIAADTYLHRVGRAGRFGNRGLAVSFLSSELDRKVCPLITDFVLVFKVDSFVLSFRFVTSTQVFDCVQARFKTKIEELPEEIDTSSYMPTAGVSGGSEFLG